MSPPLNRLLIVWAIWGPIVSALLTHFLFSRTYAWVLAIIILSGLVVLLSLIWDWLIFQINKTRPGKFVLARIHPRGKTSADVATYLCRGIGSKKGSFLGFGLPRVEIVWIKKPEKLKEVSTGEAIIYLEPGLDNEEGLLRALEEYVEVVFMNVVKVTCGDTIAKAIKIILMESFGREFLTRTTKMKSLYAEFTRKLTPNDSEKKEKFESFLKTLRNVAAGGMFESIFMYSLKFISDKLTTEIMGSDLAEKTLIDFATFLEAICIKERGEDVSLDFETELLKVHIILITRPETSSLHPHLNYLMRYSCQGFNPIFVSGMGRNTELVEKFIKKARKLQERHELIPFEAFGARGKAIKDGATYEVCTYVLEFHLEQAK